jgi:hypothetical protein
MAAEMNKSESEMEKNETSAPEVVEQEELERLAEKAARRAGETERHYDMEHDIFTK